MTNAVWLARRDGPVCHLPKGALAWPTVDCCCRHIPDQCPISNRPTGMGDWALAHVWKVRRGGLPNCLSTDALAWPTVDCRCRRIHDRCRLGNRQAGIGEWVLAPLVAQRPGEGLLNARRPVVVREVVHRAGHHQARRAVPHGARHAAQLWVHCGFHYVVRYGVRYVVHYVIQRGAHYGVHSGVQHARHLSGPGIRRAWTVMLPIRPGLHLSWGRDDGWVCVHCSSFVLRYKQSGRGSVDLHPLVLHQVYTPLREPTRDLRIHHVFNTQYASSQGFWLVVFFDRNHALRDDWPVIQERCHEVHRTAMRLHTFCQCLGMRMQPGKRWQQ